MCRSSLVVLATLLCCCIPSSVESATEVTRAVFGSGGGQAAGSSMSVSYTVGQLTVARAQSANIEVGAGFWPPQYDSVTGMPEIVTPSHPVTYRLHQNLPNPFNPRTTIRYDLPVDSRVRLRLYDVAGRLIRTLVDGFEQAGARGVVWEGLDDHGSPVSSGIYIYTLETPEYRASGKLALVR